MRVIESLGVLLACVKAVVSAQGHQLELLRQESFAGTVCTPNTSVGWHAHCIHACMRKCVCVLLTNSSSAFVVVRSVQHSLLAWTSCLLTAPRLLRITVPLCVCCPPQA